MMRNLAHAFNKKYTRAFTLAEVLITLGIIGIVAVMTTSTLLSYSRKLILKNQFKRTYSLFYNAVIKAQTVTGPVECFFWASGVLCKHYCAVYNDDAYHSCKSYLCNDGSAVSKDVNGLFTDCHTFEEELFANHLNVVKFCENNALEKGCITDEYRGVDKVKTEQNPDAEYEQNPNQGFSDSNIKNKYPAWILADGTLIMKGYKYGADGSNTCSAVYLIDINGNKGPNKWGYDLFTFRLNGDKGNGITKIVGVTYATETGGSTYSEMMK